MTGFNSFGKCVSCCPHLRFVELHSDIQHQEEVPGPLWSFLKVTLYVEVNNDLLNRNALISSAWKICTKSKKIYIQILCIELYNTPPSQLRGCRVENLKFRWRECYRGLQSTRCWHVYADRLSLECCQRLYIFIFVHGACLVYCKVIYFFMCRVAEYVVYVWYVFCFVTRHIFTMTK